LARNQQIREKLERLKQSEKLNMEMDKIIKDQQATIKEMLQKYENSEAEVQDVDEDVTQSYEVVMARIQRTKQRLDKLEKQFAEMNETRDCNRNDKVYDNAKMSIETIELSGVYGEIYKDLESKELNAGSHMITTTAEVHSHDDNNDRSAREVNWNTFRESLIDDNNLGTSRTRDFSRNDAAFDKNAKQKTKSTIKRSVSVDTLEDRTFIE